MTALSHVMNPGDGSTGRTLAATFLAGSLKSVELFEPSWHHAVLLRNLPIAEDT
jgi:hypothetical protein